MDVKLCDCGDFIRLSRTLNAPKTSLQLRLLQELPEATGSDHPLKKSADWRKKTKQAKNLIYLSISAHRIHLPEA